MSRDQPDHVQSLERGLAVLRAFSRDHPVQTLAEVARRTDLTRATARRLLLTLCRLGYVHNQGRDFRLTPKVLDLGYGYLSALDLTGLAQPHMEELVGRTRESCSAAVLDGTEIVYVARVPTKQIMTISLGVGSRLPAFATSMGRVLLADLPTDRLRCVLNASHRSALTPNTVTDVDLLCEEIERVRKQGWALVDQELELGLRAISAPLRDGTGRVIAALNVSSHVGRVSLERLSDEMCPALVHAAEQISARLARR